MDEGSFEWHFRRVIRPLVSDDDFAWAYDPERGRKAVPPSLVACALILQQRYRLSDREMERQVRFNLATKYALGLAMDDEGFDHTVLCKFRRMLVEHDQTRVCFDKFRGALIESGLIKAGEVAVIDTTHVVADIAIPNTVELVRQGVRAVLRGAEGLPMGRGLKKNLDLGMVETPVRSRGTAEELVELVSGARRLLSYLEASGEAGDSRLVPAVEQLRRILQENTDSRTKGSQTHGRGDKQQTVIEERREGVHDRLVSVVDPEARHGRKSKTKTFTGYKAQVMTSEREFIVGIEGMAGNRHDRRQVVPIVAEMERAGIKPRYLVGDKAYGDEPLGLELEEMGVKMVTPLKRERSDPYFANDRFEYLFTAGAPPKMRCPAGDETAISDGHPWQERYFHFTRCGSCPLKERCTPSAHRSVAVSPSYFFRQRKAAFNQTAGYRNLMRSRYTIEQKNSQLKHRFGLMRCRYHGLAKFRLQCLFAALAANIQRWITLAMNGPPLSAGLVGAAT